MILFLTGPPGIGKTTLAQAIAAVRPRSEVLSSDDIRLDLGATVTTNAVVEDAVNWRLFVRSLEVVRHDPTHLAIVDSTGVSKRFPYLRYALGDYEQVVVRLCAAFPYALCVRKWADAYTPKQFAFLLEKVQALSVDYELAVDGKSPQTLAQHVLARFG